MDQGTIDGARRGRAVAALVAVVLGWTALVAMPAGAAPAGAPAADVIAEALGGTVNIFTPCEGEANVIPGNGLLKVERPGSIAGTISVNVTYGGTLVPGTDYEPLPDTVEIPAGESQTILFFDSANDGTVTLTVEPGEGYTVGDPATATATIGLSDIDAICPDEETLTTTVGSQPPAIPVFDRYGGAFADTIFEIEGDLPPGLDLGVDGSWTGTATTVGTYRFVALYTLGDFAFLELPLRVVVLPEGEVPTTTTRPPTSSTTSPTRPPARPATPVQAHADFTG